MVKKLVFLALAVLTLGLQAFAQNVVTGKVTDTKGEPVVGAGVQIKGTNAGAVTDLNGNFSVKVAPNATLVISSIGYKDASIVPGNRSNLNVVLEDDSLYLDEVIVTGYNTLTRKKDLTGAISQISNRVIENQNVSSVSKILEGAVAGLNIATCDGQPGVDAGIRVRGVGSTNVNSSGALIVIDGVAVDPAISNSLSQINPQDIASVTVLKDAASTAIYGSKGANGVILITTKAGHSGKTTISFSSRLGVVTTNGFSVGAIDTAKDHYEYVWQSIYNSYRYGMNGTAGPAEVNGQWKTGVGSTTITHEQAAKFASEHLFNYKGSTTDFGCNTLGNNMAYYVPGLKESLITTGTSATMNGVYLVGLDGKLNPNAELLYDETYSDYLLSAKLRQEYSVSANGGNEKTTYYMSLNYFGDKSPLPSSEFRRITGRAKVDSWITNWLKVGANVSFAKTKTNFQPSNTWQARNPGSSQANYMRYMAISPIVSVYARDEKGNLRYYKGNELSTEAAGGVKEVNRNKYFNTYTPFGSVVNDDTSYPGYGSFDVFYMRDHDIRQHETNTLNSRVFAEIPFLQHFKFRTDFAYDNVTNMETRYLNGSSNSRVASQKGGFLKQLTSTNILNMQDQLSYSQDFGKHHVDALALYEYNDYEQEWVRYSSRYELIPGFISSANFISRNLAATGMTGPGYGHDIVRLASYLGRANYIYNDTYFLSASIRRDGSSKFKTDANRWGTFWSVGAGWRFSNEPFMADVDWLNNGKIRTSYGVIGNQNAIGNYSGYTTWSYSGIYKSATNGNGDPSGFKLSRGGFVNDSLTWENVNTFDVGLDLTLFDRVDITLDWYNRVTQNSFFNQPVSKAAVGQKSIQQNCAQIQNRGIEFEINADIIRTSDFRWNVGLNGTHYTTKLKSLPQNIIESTGQADWWTGEGTWACAPDSWSAAAGTYGSLGGDSTAKGYFYLRGPGRDWYNIYLHRYMGVDQATGLPLYLHRVTPQEETAGTYPGKKAGDGVETTDYRKSDFWEVGSAIPDIIGGLNSTMTWRSWSLSANFAFQLGGKFYSQEYAQCLYNGTSNQGKGGRLISKEVLGNTWTPENTNAKFPMQWYPAGNATWFNGTSANGNDWKFTDIALFSASYLRLKNITLAYSVPAKYLKGKMAGLRVYASGDNVFILSAHKGVDPSLSATGGYELGAYVYPNIQSFTLGVNVDF